MERFRHFMWSAMEGIFARILAHPFVAGLTDGSLPRDAFEHYVVQDALYLVDYARALAIVGAKGPDEHAIAPPMRRVPSRWNAPFTSGSSARWA
jgi:thiaminase/transcriptional activator TenA